jgi:condensin complex subunit 3
MTSNVAEEALISVFTTRAEVFESVEFDGKQSLRFRKLLLIAVDDYWKTLTPQKAFLARVFVDYCISTKVC